MLILLKLLKLHIRLNSLKRLEGCVIQGLIDIKALIIWGRLMGKDDETAKQQMKKQQKQKYYYIKHL